MNFYMKQKVFSFSDRFTIYDENGEDCYYVEGEIFSFGKKLHLYDRRRNEIAFISQKILSFHPRYFISISGYDIAEIIKEFTFFRPAYSIALTDGRKWNVKGDFWDHEYTIQDGGLMVAGVSKEWFTWGDAYRISVSDEVDPILALSAVLVIDACIEAERNN